MPWPGLSRRRHSWRVARRRRRSKSIVERRKPLARLRRFCSPNICTGPFLLIHALVFFQSVLDGAKQYDEAAGALASAAPVVIPADPSSPSHTSPSPLMRELMDNLFPSGYSFREVCF